jgi:hypothetical protein
LRFLSAAISASATRSGASHKSVGGALASVPPARSWNLEYVNPVAPNRLRVHAWQTAAADIGAFALARGVLS